MLRPAPRNQGFLNAVAIKVVIEGWADRKLPGFDESAASTVGIAEELLSLPILMILGSILENQREREYVRKVIPILTGL